MISLQDLPNEILHQIFLQLPPTSIPIVQCVCRRFNDLSLALLWRHHCRTLYKYWAPSHRIQERLDANVNHTDWKCLFLERHATDRQAKEILNSILASQSGRLPKAERILQHNYDVKDKLLQTFTTAYDDAEDVLARRFYSNLILEALHRSIAVEQWIGILHGQQVSLEKALGSFDLFVLGHMDTGAFEDISHWLDDLAHDVRSQNSNFMDMTPRLRCLALLEHLRSRNLLGLNGSEETTYRDLQNNFIGMALKDPDHPSLPLISSAIFCCVAQRLGLDAYPCGFPFHVLAVIKPSGELDLDGRELREGQSSPWMYLDPYRSAIEVEVENLTTQLVSLGIQKEEHHTYLDACSTTEIVLRCAKNLVTSVQSLARSATRASTLETSGAYYAALWAHAILTPTEPGTDNTYRGGGYLPHILQRIESTFLYDFNLLERHILPLVRDAVHRGELYGTIRGLRSRDATPRPAKKRTPEIAQCVRYKVGQYFRHRRYSYFAIITGWDPECLASDVWISLMGVNELPGGQHQSFYHVQ